MAQTKTIAVAMQLNLPFQWHYGIYMGVQQYARENKRWHCIIDEFPEYRLGRRSRGERPYDGIIARTSRELRDSAKRHRIPLVNVWRASPVKNVPNVSVDNYAIGQLCAEHLLDRGFRRFGFISRDGHGADDEELAAFLRCVSEAGYSCSTLRADNGDLTTGKAWGQMQDMIFAWLAAFEPPVGIRATASNRLTNFSALSALALRALCV